VEAEYSLAYGADGRPWWIFLPGVVGGLLLLVGGAHLLVDGAVSVARALGISERVIGLTMVAFGTSLPELASSLAAARRREGDIVLGNVVGSNIFNVFCVLGLTVLVVPIRGSLGQLAPELIVGVLLAVLMVPMLLVGRRLYLGRVEGAILVAAYLAYLAYLFS
jgi:cation:H+ antiporter